MRLLIHTCCANCAIYPLQRLRTLGIDYTGIWFNPNIQPFEEYQLRLNSLKRLSEEWRFPVIYNDNHDMKLFLRTILESPEALLLGEHLNIEAILEKAPYGKRCQHCYSLRLEETARTAKDSGFDAFSTTLLVSPYQGFDVIVKTGKELAERYNIEFFFEDFRTGYRDGMKVSREMGLYRQKYCGCIFSKIERNSKGLRPFENPDKELKQLFKGEFEGLCPSKGLRPFENPDKELKQLFKGEFEGLCPSKV